MKNPGTKNEIVTNECTRGRHQNHGSNLWK